jgi:ABC-2 type transport system ATP-binding protein
VAEVSVEPLVADGLAKRYRGRHEWALEGIDLSFRAGAITALIGPNGAGKSTLLRAFMGFETPTRGRALVRGVEARRRRADALRHVGYVSQKAALYRDLRVADHLALASALRAGFDREGAGRRLRDLAIPLDVRAGELSGGQRAQVALAIAIGTRAPILILDEPMSSLDPIARQDFLAMLSASVAGTGATVVVASHIVAELEGVCDDVVVLAPGHVMLHDSIAHARATHSLVPADAGVAGDAVATFERAGQRRVSLVRVSDGGNSTLDDLVLGYLNAARQGARTC